jgi:hypothetical protein
LGGFASSKTIINRFRLATRASGARVQISTPFILPTKKGHLSVSFSVGGDGEIKIETLRVSSSRHRRIVAARRSIHSLPSAPCFGRFRFAKTINNRF